MRKILASAFATLAVSSPAVAQNWYVGAEAGLVFPRNSDANIFVDYTTVNAPGVVGTPAGPADASYGDAIKLDANTGYDIGIFGGYDFGGFRLEGEVDWKHANLDDLEFDSSALAAINTALNRPSTAPGSLPALSSADIELDDAVGVFSLMLNGLVDFDVSDAFSFQAGLGAGWAKAELVDDEDSGFAWQLIAGTEYKLTPSLGIGLRYKYFSTGSMDFADEDGFAVAGNPRILSVTPPGSTVPVAVTQTTNANIETDFESKVRMHSLVATLTYNFGMAAPEPMPAPAPVPEYVAPPPPATQTCPDGSVILATAVCPAPPPPPPPSAGERG